ncbi:MAG: IclR family transcriptional regulator, partial [Burkholderiales bacterium]|nr:IclR family transcriptional regulator [Anaerolineae bacterium]
DEVERLRAICLPHMHTLQQDSGETVNLAVMEGSDIVYLEIVDSGNLTQNHARVGGRHPAHTTALGKAMLAYLPDEARQAALPRVLRSRTRQSILERQLLLEELEQTMARGFAEDECENVDGAICLGAPVANASGAVVAAISISAVSARARDTWKTTILPKLIERTQAVSVELGFRGTMRPM